MKKYLMDREIEILERYEGFNMAKCRYVGCEEEFIADTNFILKEPSKEKYITVTLGDELDQTN